MKTYEFIVSTPDGVAFQDQVEMISVRGLEGDLAIMADHIPLMTATRPCDLHIHQKNGQILIAKVDSGMLAVSHDAVRFLTERYTLHNPD